MLETPPLRLILADLTRADKIGAMSLFRMEEGGHDSLMSHFFAICETLSAMGQGWKIPEHWHYEPGAGVRFTTIDELTQHYPDSMYLDYDVLELLYVGEVLCRYYRKCAPMWAEEEY